MAKEPGYKDLLAQYLRGELPEWYPDAIIERTVKAYDVGDKMNSADYENAPLIAKGLAKYIKEEYNPTVADHRKHSNPMRTAIGDFATTRGEGQGMHLMRAIQDNAKGTRFEQNPKAYWPGNANVQYGYAGEGISGFVDHDAPNTANLDVNFEAGVGTTAHEFEHTNPVEVNAMAPVADVARVGYERGNSKDMDEEDREDMLNYSVLQMFVDEGKLPANTLDSVDELMAALVGRESEIQSGKSVQDDEVLGTVLSIPRLRDWYLSQRFRKDGLPPED